ncbi:MULTISPECIES: hypothetical protein [Kitasatospora]|uniref:Secreted protein n=1 Tax=Kitasatospora cathayae TaxID=3004092 RepID=A0ABY7QE20_9ACTN|nr:hypothetical protein [Kitasatospora sp. HUAS 3-15]WBP90791.1 hypothetical protein O1G21_36290 [Kitasatospora sp. HUAS 3-15]
MLSRRTLRSAVAVLGVGAAIALSASTPAFAANEGDHWLYTPNCTADQEIQLQYVNGGWHDQQELNPTRVGGTCEFVMTDNGAVISDTWGAGSGWHYDGPGHYICVQVRDWTAGTTIYGICN